jgi:hypothetical protein
MKNALIAFITVGIAAAFCPQAQAHDDDWHHESHYHHHHHHHHDGHDDGHGHGR